MSNTGEFLIKFPQNFLTTLKLDDINSEENFKNLNLQRVELNDYFGWIKYCGPLLHKKDNDIWAGVDWDEPARGKHNGTLEGKEYFNCSKKLKKLSEILETNLGKTSDEKTINEVWLAENSGSLVKLSKLNIGIDFLDAVNFKYNFDNYADEMSKFINDSAEKNLFISSGKKKIEIELVGKNKATKKFSDYSQIALLDLSNSNISSFNKLDNLTEFRNIKELTITRSLIGKWSTFLRIVNTFKTLEYFNFSENCLIFDEEFWKEKESFLNNFNFKKASEIEDLSNKLSVVTNLNDNNTNNKNSLFNNSNPNNQLKLKNIIFNKNELTIYDLKTLEFLLSNIKTLYLFGNYINKDTFLALKSEKNLLSHFDNTSKFQVDLSNLEVISLENNRIDNPLSILSLFKITGSLKSINLNNNRVCTILNCENNESSNQENNNEEESNKSLIESLRSSLINNVEELFLDFNKLENKDILLELEKFTQLKRLFITGNKLFNDMGYENTLKTLVGRLVHLTTLNNNIISRKERREYEKHYIKKCAEKYFTEHPIFKAADYKSSLLEDYMRQHHPSYLILRKKHFDPVEDIIWNMKIDEAEQEKVRLEKEALLQGNSNLMNQEKPKYISKHDNTQIKTNPNNKFYEAVKHMPIIEDKLNVGTTIKSKLSSTMISVILKSKDKELTKKLPKSTTFSTLRSVVSKLFKIEDFSFSTTILGFELKIIDEGKTLDGYDIAENSTIFIN